MARPFCVGIRLSGGFVFSVFFLTPPLLQIAAPQADMASRTGLMLLPKSVSEYSTLGGTTGKTSRRTRPSLSRSRNCRVSTLGVAQGTALRNCEKRKVSPVSL